MPEALVFHSSRMPLPVLAQAQHSYIISFGSYLTANYLLNSSAHLLLDAPERAASDQEYEHDDHCSEVGDGAQQDPDLIRLPSPESQALRRKHGALFRCALQVLET